VFNGFEGLVKSLYSSIYTDIKVSPATGKVITVTPQQLQQLRSLAGVNTFSLVTEEKALLQNEDGDYKSVVLLKGVDSNYRFVTGVEQHMVVGEYRLGNVDSPLLILGAGVESAINVATDRNIFPLKLYMPKRNISSSAASLDLMSDISIAAVNTSGTFVIQQEFDNKYAITNLDFVKQKLQMGENDYGGIEIGLKDASQEEKVQQQVRGIFGNGYNVQTRYEQNQSLYNIMRVEKWVIYAILSLILVVAAFNMIGALTMLVLEKEKDISVLVALGSNRQFIQRIFLNEGLLLALIGGGIGMLLALLIAWLQLKFKLIPLTGGSFLIDYFPVALKATDFLLVGATVVVIALLASWLPSKKAALNEFNLRSE
jgi:lipoprotein-releasing system permease protein